MYMRNLTLNYFKLLLYNSKTMKTMTLLNSNELHSNAFYLGRLLHLFFAMFMCYCLLNAVSCFADLINSLHGYIY